MKKVIATIVVLSAVLVTLFFINGCFGQKVAEEITEEAIEKAIEEESGGDIEVDLSEEEMTIKSDEGEMTIGTGAELPDDFPKEVPVYPDMEIVTSVKSTEGGRDFFSISGATSDPGDKVFNWYKDKMSGWEITGEFTTDMGDDGKSYTISGNDGKYNITVMILEDDEGTTIVCNVEGG